MNQQNASEAEFAEFYEQHIRRIYGYCLRRISPDRVDDAVAETFLVAWRRIGDVPRNDSALPWLYGVAYRVLSTQRRGRSRQQRLKTKLAAVGTISLTGTEDLVVSAEESAQVLRALTRLNPTDQEILRLSVWEELSHAEIALALDISVGAVKQRAHQARKNLTREYNRILKRPVDPLTAQKGGRT